jgi:EAL domain-containing protein (putative c-di-GMP-specific phosphodiesterase class I)
MVYTFGVDPPSFLYSRTDPSLERLAQSFEQKGYAGCWVVNFSDIYTLQKNLGSDFYTHIIHPLMQQAIAFFTDMFPQESHPYVDMGAGFYLGLYSAQLEQQAVQSVSDMQAKAHALQEMLSTQMLSLPCAEKLWDKRIAVGVSFAFFNPLLSSYQQVMQLGHEAFSASERDLHYNTHVSHRGHLEQLLVSRNTYAVFQPIVSLHNKRVFAYEGLSRGPEGSPYHSPAYVLAIAERLNISTQIDRLFRHTVLKACVAHKNPVKFFINVLPSSFFDPELESAAFKDMLEAYQISPSHVVLEVSEKNFFQEEKNILERLKGLRGLGIEWAMDDVGTGYSGLQRMVLLDPSYLKIDQSLIKNIHTNATQRSLLSFLLRMADETGATVIAEGIEHKEELDVLMDLGVCFGQGYYLGRPERF